MKKKNTFNNEENKTENPPQASPKQRVPVDPSRLTADPQYISLIECYQRAEFAKSGEILTALFEQYPAHPRLIEFQRDLDIQLSLKNIEVSHSKTEKEKKKRTTRNLSFFSVFSVIMVLAIFVGSFLVLSKLADQKMRDSDAVEIASLEQQVNDLLTSGQPKVAAEVIEKIISIDPAYAGLQELKDQTILLLILEAKYENAVMLMNEDKNSEALKIFQEIDAQYPGLWDTARRISDVEKSVEITELMQQGDVAYQRQDWKQVISFYEAVHALDPDLDDPLMKEQLLKSYLRRIIEMLESKTTTIDEIENAEQYYRKAVSMIPQSKTFAIERENLQQVSSSLLELKFTQTANSLLQDRYQTFTSISKAVSYLNKAANLNPTNSRLQFELQNAQLYQIAFQNFQDLNWSQAIKYLRQIIESDWNYANGDARHLLYDAYYMLGSQYYAVGLYIDARYNLEQAEILAFDESDNLLQLFQVQMALGNTMAKLDDYQNAVSYYQYGLSSINIYSRVSDFPDLYSLLISADGLASQGEYQQAANTFRQLYDEIPLIYTLLDVEVPDGTTLPFFAAEYQSTTSAIIATNNLPTSMIISFGSQLLVPTLD